MAQEPIESEQSFKDYYEILHLHSEADAAMVDQAYWHLARLYNAAIPDDADAREQLDVLNEAYSVLRSPELRLSYDQTRNELLKSGALPEPVDPEEEDAPPLAVMAKQKPKARKQGKKKSGEGRQFKLPELPWPSVAAVLIFAALAGGAVAVGLPLPLAIGLLVVGPVLGLTAFAASKLPGLPALPSKEISLPSIRAPRLPERSTDRDSVSPDSLHESTAAMRQRWRTETHDATSSLPENTIWPKDTPPAPRVPADADTLVEPSESAGESDAAETKNAETLADLPGVTEPPDSPAAPALGAVPIEQDEADARAALRRRWQIEPPQEPSLTAPQQSAGADAKGEPISITRDKLDAKTSESPPPSTTREPADASTSDALPDGDPEAPSVPSPSDDPPLSARELGSSTEALRRRWRADAPKDVPAIAPQPSEEAPIQAQPALVLHEQDDANAEKRGPLSTTSDSPEPASEAESPASDDDAPEPPSMDEGLADSLAALRRRWRADAPKDLSTAFPQHTVWAKLESSEKDPPGDDDSDAEPAPDSE